MIQLRKLTIADIPACRALWQARFFDSDAFCDWYFHDRFRPELSIGLFEDGVLRSMAHGRRMKIHLNGTILPVLMIGGVSTATEAEGRGYMKRVMAEMEKIGTEEQLGLLILATETPALYKSSGYEVCAKALYAAATGEDVQPLNYDRASYDIQALLDCCKSSCGTVPFFPVRTAAYMQSRIDELCCEGGGLLTIRADDACIEGYAFADPNSGRADEVIARSTGGYRKLLMQLPKGTVAMLPPHLDFAGERDSGAWTMCKPLSHAYRSPDDGWDTRIAFCPETY